jgi:hypothetical protein
MSRIAAWLMWSVKALAFSIVVGLAAAIYFHRDVIDAIYKNVDDIVDGEMPPTVTAFQSGPEIVSTIGGSGEGLNCSLPSLANMFFDNSSNLAGKRHLVLQRFRQACVFHDLCYRHGLATYGYNQNDCDRVLQNEAFRLCLYIRNGNTESSSARCQTDSKMILAGVSIGGSEAYRAWDRSTYFEFASDPARSSKFSVARVVDHPFKQVDPAKYGDESDQVILTFTNVRSNLTVSCVTCKDAPVFQWTRDPNEVSAELRSVGFKSLPEALLRREEQMLSATGPVWLPPRRRHAAPHLLIDSDGKNHLIWMSRNNPEDTISCIVLTDAAELLTHTLPKRDFCGIGAGSQLTMVEVDMFATSPLPMEIPGRPPQDRIFTTGLTAQKTTDHSLSFCSRSASRAVDHQNKDKHDDQAKCPRLIGERVAAGAGLGAFQNFAVVRLGQQILFARDVVLPPGSVPTSISQQLFGETYSPSGVMLKIDLAPPATADGPLVPTIQKIVPFRIDDSFDPMMPISRKKDDLRFLSLQTSKETVGVRSIDFARDTPVVDSVSLTVNDAAVDLHRSWGLRPVIVMETKGGEPKTKLVFSRAEIAVEPGKPIAPATNNELLRLETLVFERDATAGSEMPFTRTGGATCQVTYTFKVNTDYPCYRAFDPERPMRSSPAAKMQASQLLVGHFAGRDGHGIAFPDVCRRVDPLVLRPKGDTFVPTIDTVGEEYDIKRSVVCEPLFRREDITGPIRSKPAAEQPPPAG